MIRFFRVAVPASVAILMATEIALAYSAYLSVLILVQDFDPYIYLIYEGGLLNITLVALTIILGLYFSDLYSEINIRSITLLLQDYLLALGLAFLGQAVLSYANRGLLLPRWQMIQGSVVALIVLPAWRIFYVQVVRRNAAQRRVLFVGCNDLCRRIAHRITLRGEFAMVVSGHVDNDAEPADDALGLHLGGLHDLRRVAETVQPDLIVTGLKERRGQLPVADLLHLRLSGTRVEEAATVFESLFGRVAVDTLRPSQLIYSSALGPNPRMIALQAVYSWLLAAAGVIVFSPVLLLTALAVKLTSPGPVLYRQRRVGYRGRVFEVIKFRSMRADAEVSTGAVWAAKDDPRVTPLGRWLRRLRFDELPQLFNVLRGDMAIVGPRPERPEFVEILDQQIPFYRQRLFVRPGVTGWAQINHAYSDSVEDSLVKLEYDLYYLKNLSPALDAYIIFNTAKVMLLQRGSQ